MTIQKIVVYSMDQNVFIVYDEVSKEGVVIDPGNEARMIINYVKEKGITVKAILLTHGHGDHIGAVPDVKAEFDCPVVCHRCEKDVLEDSDINLSTMIVGKLEFSPDIIVEEGDVFSFGGIDVKFIHTPGHTPGGMCLYIENENVLFSGDTLFYGSIGRTDFPNTGRKKAQPECGCGYPMSENYNKLISSVKNKLYCLPDETRVFTGHGCETTIGFEKKNNPFVRG